MTKSNKYVYLILTIGFVFFEMMVPAMIDACSVCFGDPTSPMSYGLKMGIVSLLVVLTFVLSGLAVFFLQVRKRARENVI